MLIPGKTTEQTIGSDDNTVSFGAPGQPPDGSAKLSSNGNQFTINVPASTLNEPGFTCTGTLIVSGTINGNTTSGTFSSSALVCIGIAGTVTGNFSAEKTGAGSQSRIQQDLTSVVGTTIRRLVE